MATVEVELRLAQARHELDIEAVNRVRDLERPIEAGARLLLLAARVAHLNGQETRDRLVQGAPARRAQSQQLGLCAGGERRVLPDEGFPQDERLIPEAEPRAQEV